MALDDARMNKRLLDLAESPRARFWRVELDALSLPERVFRAVWELEAEVNNGGFGQYFWNSSGELAAFGVEALRAIGAEQTATLLDQAINVVGRQTEWSDEVLRRTHLGKLTNNDAERLGECDQAFLRYPENLTRLLYNYVWTYRTEIAGAGDVLICPI